MLHLMFCRSFSKFCFGIVPEDFFWGKVWKYHVFGHISHYSTIYCRKVFGRKNEISWEFWFFLFQKCVLFNTDDPNSCLWNQQEQEKSWTGRLRFLLCKLMFKDASEDFVPKIIFSDFPCVLQISCPIIRPIKFSFPRTLYRSPVRYGDNRRCLPTNHFEDVLLIFSIYFQFKSAD